MKYRGGSILTAVIGSGTFEGVKLLIATVLSSAAVGGIFLAIEETLSDYTPLSLIVASLMLFCTLLWSIIGIFYIFRRKGNISNIGTELSGQTNLTVERAKEVKLQLKSLTKAEKEVIRQLLIKGQMISGQIDRHLAEQGFEKPSEVLNSIYVKTNFTTRNFAGQASLNPILRDILEKEINND